MTAIPLTRFAALGLCLAALAGCGGSPSEQVDAETDTADAPTGRTATATLNSASGSGVTGTVSFTEQGAGVHVFAMISGLTPGPHGFHIHENGDCSAPDASSAGGHFNPTSMPHGGPDAEQHHVGDLGNVIADEAGNVNFEAVLSDLSLVDGPNSIIGRAVVVHEGADDLTSQPAGDSGGRIACGVVEAGTH